MGIPLTPIGQGSTTLRMLRRLQWDSTLPWETRWHTQAVGSDACFQRDPTSMRPWRPWLPGTYFQMEKWPTRGCVYARKARQSLRHHSLASVVSWSTGFALAGILFRPWPNTLDYSAKAESEKEAPPFWREVGSTPRLWKSNKRDLEDTPTEWQPNVQTFWEDKALPS